MSAFNNCLSAVNAATAFILFNFQCINVKLHESPTCCTFFVHSLPNNPSLQRQTHMQTLSLKSMTLVAKILTKVNAFVLGAIFREIMKMLKVKYELGPQKSSMRHVLP